MPEIPESSAPLDRLSVTLTKGVGDGRIGSPRFIRWLDRIANSGSVGESLAFALETCSLIFGSKPVRKHQSGDDVLHGTIHAVWADGSSVLISAGPGGVDVGAGPEIMLLGTSGAMYFDGTLDRVAVTAQGDHQ